MTLSHQQARAFYDRFGARQDWQRFYEDRAVADLLAHAAFGQAEGVVEFGCGTGRIAERLLSHHLPPRAHYLGVDISPTMVGLARQRLAPFGPRAEVRLSDGAMALAANPESFDRVLSTYVLDLLSEEDIEALIDEARRVLVPGGLIALVSLSHGCTAASRLVERLWHGLYALQPRWVGGCRPLALEGFIDATGWEVLHQRRVSQLGLASEVLVAQRR